MAKPTQTTDGKRRRKGANAAIWVLMAMLILGLGGFGVTNFGGSVNSIGSVGDRDIGAEEYARTVQQQMRQLSAQYGQQITFEQAQALGIDAGVRQQLIVGKALDGEAARIGVSVGDARVAAALTEMPEFQGPTGQFDREMYRETLQRNDLTEAEYEADLRDRLTRTLIRGAVLSGFAAPQTLTDRLFAYRAETRGMTLLRLTEADLPAPLPDPTEAELKAYYDENIAAFTKPEAKRITYAALLPEELAATMEIDETAVRKLYDDRIDEFVQPERRLVERLVYPDEAAAAAAKARLDAGETFETLVAERNLTLDDIDLGDVSKADLGAAGEAVFALEGPGVAGPLASDLGPALFRMNAILSAQETTFDEAKPDLIIEYQQEAARRAIADRVEEIDDLLAGGATLEDLTKEQGMTLGTVDFSAESSEAIAAYPAFRDAATALAEGDFPEAVILDDGGLAALRFDEIVPAAPIPFEEAAPAVTESWRTDALSRALAARAAVIKTEVEGGANIGAYGILSVTPATARDGFIEGVPEDFLATVFTMAEGEIRVIEGAGFTGLVRLDAITPAKTEGDEAAALKAAIAANSEESIAQDALALFSAGLVAQAGIRLDDAAISAVHAQFP